MERNGITNGEAIRTILELFLYMWDWVIDMVGHNDWL